MQRDNEPITDDLEQKIQKMVEKFQKLKVEINQKNQNEFAKIVAKYNARIKEMLSFYSAIDYAKQKENKISYRAKINYSYQTLDYSSKLVKLIDTFEIITPEIEAYLLALKKHISQKGYLIDTKYKDSATSELHSFHNKDF